MKTITSINIVRIIRHQEQHERRSLWHRLFPVMYMRYQLRRVRRGKGLEL